MARKIFALSFLVLFLAADYAVPANQGLEKPKPPPGWPGRIDFPHELFTDLANLDALPEPSMKDPFAIGEALYRTGMIAEAVVSLLDLMGVVVEPKGGTPGLQGPAPERVRFSLPESDVRTLIAWGEADAASAGESDDGPFSFRELFNAVSPILPGVSIDRLAAAYSQAYADRSDDLAPLVMMGQPIEPDTPLMRTQIWLLLVDGFVPPEGTPQVSKRGATPRWGTAAAALRSLSPSLPRWTPTKGVELLSILRPKADALSRTNSPGPGKAAETYEVVLYNSFAVKLLMGSLGSATGNGVDQAQGTLVRRADGTFQGIFRAVTNASLSLESPLGRCGNKSKALQTIRVVGRRVDDRGPTHPLSDLTISSGRLDGGYLRLAFYPETPGRYLVRDPCQKPITPETGDLDYIPFSDAVWSRPEIGLAIGLPRSGTLLYYDMSRQSKIVGESLWYVQVEKKGGNP